MNDNTTKDERDTLITTLAKELYTIQNRYDDLLQDSRDTEWNLQKTRDDLKATERALEDVLEPLVKDHLIEYLTHPNDIVRLTAKKSLRDSKLANEDKSEYASLSKAVHNRKRGY